jgi:hypothetical protein
MGLPITAAVRALGELPLTIESLRLSQTHRRVGREAGRVRFDIRPSGEYLLRRRTAKPILTADEERSFHTPATSPALG